MDQDFLKKIEEKLKEELRTSEKRLAALADQDPYADVSRVNDNAASDTEAAEEADHDRVVALKNELAANIKKVKKALDKIAAGAYGKCEKCGQEIDKKRLEVFSEAVLCFDCERRRE